MLTKLLIATICLAALAQGARPYGRGPNQGERPRGERPNIRPGSVPGREEPRGFPTTLPSTMSTNLRDLFDRMQMQQDTGRRLDLPQWQSTLEVRILKSYMYPQDSCYMSIFFVKGKLSDFELRVLSKLSKFEFFCIFPELPSEKHISKKGSLQYISVSNESNFQKNLVDET